jgi:hypothetical protein
MGLAKSQSGDQVPCKMEKEASLWNDEIVQSTNLLRFREQSLGDSKEP